MRSAELGLNNGTERGRRGGDDAIFRFFLMSGDDGFGIFLLLVIILGSNAFMLLRTLE